MGSTEKDIARFMTQLGSGTKVFSYAKVAERFHTSPTWVRQHDFMIQSYLRRMGCECELRGDRFVVSIPLAFDRPKGQHPACKKCDYIRYGITEYCHNCEWVQEPKVEEPELPTWQKVLMKIMEVIG